MMKNSKLVFGILFALILALPTSAETIKIIKKNGGFWGYKNVSEEHIRPSLGPTSHTLTCLDPGYAKCAWEETPTNSINVDELNTLLEQVDLAMLNGNESSSLKWSDGVFASWTTIEGVTTIIINIP